MTPDISIYSREFVALAVAARDAAHKLAIAVGRGEVFPIVTVSGTQVRVEIIRAGANPVVVELNVDAAAVIYSEGGFPDENVSVAAPRPTPAEGGEPPADLGPVVSNANKPARQRAYDLECREDENGEWDVIFYLDDLTGERIGHDHNVAGALRIAMSQRKQLDADPNMTMVKPVATIRCGQ